MSTLYVNVRMLLRYKMLTVITDCACTIIPMITGIVIDQVLHTPHSVLPDTSASVKQQPSPNSTDDAESIMSTAAAVNTAPVDTVYKHQSSNSKTFIGSILLEVKHAWSFSTLSATTGQPGQRSFCDCKGLSAAVWSVTLVSSL
jgi:hypothetical protein